MAAPELTSDVSLSTAGYFRLSWSAPSHRDQPTGQYELQQASDRDFTDATTLYQGPDEATVVSGFPDRIYYYRVRMLNSDTWSESVQVEVRHHPMSRAIGFFALGAVMFIAMMITLIKGARGQNRT